MYFKIFDNNKLFLNNFSQSTLKEMCPLIKEHIFGNN